MQHLSLDTNIYLKAHFGKAKERQKCDKLIFTYSYTPLIVKSVKREFHGLLDKTTDFYEDLIEKLEEKKTFNQALKEIEVESKKFRKTSVKTYLKIVNMTPKELEQNITKRQEYLLEIHKKISNIKQEFEADIADFEQENQDYPTAIEPNLATLNPHFLKINKPFLPKQPIHWPDTEHWVRSATHKKDSQTVFLTNDYFGVNKDNPHKIKLQVQKIINKTLQTNLILKFFY